MKKHMIIKTMSDNDDSTGIFGTNNDINTITVTDDVLTSINSVWSNTTYTNTPYNSTFTWPTTTTIPTSIWNATDIGMFNVTSNGELILSKSGKEIVKIGEDGKISWPNGVDVDEAAKALAGSLVLSAEIASKITSSTKSRIRDSVFESIIEIAEEKGSLTAEDLKYFLKSSKIIEKLKKVD